ncbi:unnamed protein product [Staurois parvus]|uniref:Uncharacterized protein n=1 Tax=Staurois parvus TaxID=386267 RepID=A0ABN9ALE4_9NEOB|nr:unnamed protein product [Staurois parvus]
MGPLCPRPNSKKAYEKGTRGISWGPVLTLGPRAVPEFPNGQSALHHFQIFILSNKNFCNFNNHFTFNMRLAILKLQCQTALN